MSKLTGRKVANIIIFSDEESNLQKSRVLKLIENKEIENAISRLSKPVPPDIRLVLTKLQKSNLKLKKDLIQLNQNLENLKHEKNYLVANLSNWMNDEVLPLVEALTQQKMIKKSLIKKMKSALLQMCAEFQNST